MLLPAAWVTWSICTSLYGSTNPGARSLGRLKNDPNIRILMAGHPVLRRFERAGRSTVTHPFQLNDGVPMGFLSGTTTFQRYWITEDPTPALGPDHIAILEKFRIGNRDTPALDDPHVGFLAGAHMLDTKFAVEKNIIGDALHFGVRVDTDQIPSAIKKAWLQMELLALTVDNPSGKPTKAQRQEAKEAVESRCVEEAGSGKFRRMSQVSVLWDASNDLIYLGSTSPTVTDACVDLLQRAFEIEVDRITAGKLAHTYATAYELVEQLHNLTPSAFVEGVEPGITWWNGMSDNYDYLGNEFLLWLWWNWEVNGEAVTLSDDSKVSGMFARTLSLDCPQGEFGKETISATSPVVLPEAILAIQSGKLPRKAGLTLVRHDQQYDLNIQAETFSVGSARITPLGDAADVDEYDRIQSIRTFSETLDLLFDVFCERRIGKMWKSELRKIRQWLRAEKPSRLHAA